MSTDTVWGTAKNTALRTPLAYVIVAAQAVLLGGIAIFVGSRGWDDGAITLAFAKTFALHGEIALTPSSEIVEGFSSPSWFLLNALFASFGLSFDQLIAASQVAAAACICATTLVLARTCRLVVLGPFLTLCVLLSFVFWGATFAEAANGMEMGLLALSCLLLTNEIIAPKPNYATLAIAALLIVTTRFEGAYYAAFLAAPLLLAKRYKTFAVIAAVCTAVFAAMTLWRLSTFSDFLPNTVWAKSNVPYHRSGLAGLKGHMAGAVEYLLFFTLPFFLSAMLLPWRDAAAGLRAPSFKTLCLIAPVIAAITFNGMIGSNTGYMGRMEFFAFPYGILLIALALDVLVPKLSYSAGMRQLAAVLFIGMTLTSLALAFPYRAVLGAWQGASEGVTPFEYAMTGRIVSRIREAAGLPRMVFMSPDVGGLGLCCEDIRIVDSALLTNRMLAKNSYKALTAVLTTEKPDVIYTHDYWSDATNIFENEVFKADYVPLFAGRMYFWVRRPIRDLIEKRGLGCEVQTWTDQALLHDLVKHRYEGGSTTDVYQFMKAGRVFVLRQEPADELNRIEDYTVLCP